MLDKTEDDAALLPSGFRPTRTSLCTVGAYDDEMPTATNGAHSIPLPLQGVVRSSIFRATNGAHRVHLTEQTERKAIVAKHRS